jgi:hypothetical protein
VDNLLEAHSPVSLKEDSRISDNNEVEAFLAFISILEHFQFFVFDFISKYK